MSYGVGLAAQEAHELHSNHVKERQSELLNKGNKYLESNLDKLLRKFFLGRSDIPGDFASFGKKSMIDLCNLCGSKYDFTNSEIIDSVISVLWSIYSNNSSSSTQLAEHADALNKQNPGRY